MLVAERRREGRGGEGDSIHEKWQRSLTSGNEAFTGSQGRRRRRES